MRQRGVAATAVVFVALSMAACTAPMPRRAAAPPPPDAPAAALASAAAAPGQPTPAVDGSEAPRHERVASMVDVPGFVSASQTAKFHPDLVSRMGSGVARSLAGLGRSLMQLIDDLR